MTNLVELFPGGEPIESVGEMDPVAMSEDLVRGFKGINDSLNSMDNFDDRFQDAFGSVSVLLRKITPELLENLEGAHLNKLLTSGVQVVNRVIAGLTSEYCTATDLNQKCDIITFLRQICENAEVFYGEALGRKGALATEIGMFTREVGEISGVKLIFKGQKFFVANDVNPFGLKQGTLLEAEETVVLAPEQLRSMSGTVEFVRELSETGKLQSCLITNEALLNGAVLPHSRYGAGRMSGERAREIVANDFENLRSSDVLARKKRLLEAVVRKISLSVEDVFR